MENFLQTICLCEKTKNPDCSSTAPSNPRPINLVRICSWAGDIVARFRSLARGARPFRRSRSSLPPRRARGLTSFPVILVFYSHVPFVRCPPLVRPARSPDASLPSRLLPRRQRRAEPVEMLPHLPKLRILLALGSLPRRDVPLYHHTRGRARHPFRYRTVVRRFFHRFRRFALVLSRRRSLLRLERRPGPSPDVVFDSDRVCSSKRFHLGSKTRRLRLQPRARFVALARERLRSAAAASRAAVTARLTRRPRSLRRPCTRCRPRKPDENADGPSSPSLSSRRFRRTLRAGVRALSRRP